MQTTRGPQKSFIEVLEDEIRSDLRKEIEAEVQARYGVRAEGQSSAAREQAPSPAVHAASRLEAWLASHVGPMTFTRKAAHVYGTPSRPAAAATSASAAAAAAAAPTEPTAGPIRSTILFTVTSPAEFFALEILNRQSPVKLSVSFTADELKSVWRKAALKSHPDRFAGADEITKKRATVLFRELADAHATLSALTLAA